MASRSGFATVIKGYRAWARRRGHDFTLTPEQFAALIQLPCRYCGQPPSNVMKRGRPSAFRYSGLDRIDNTQGYTVTNVVPCCRVCNWAKGSRTVEEFQMWISQVAAGYELARVNGGE